MTWIKTIPPEEAQGLLKEIYAPHLKRSGRVGNVITAMSLNPALLKAREDLRQAMAQPTENIDARRREMIAAVTSGLNRCTY